MATSPPAGSLSPGQQALLTQKVHVQPGALARSGGNVAERLPSAWHAATAMVRGLRGIPDEALHWWAAQPAGHIVLTARENRYETGSFCVGDRTLGAVSFISLNTLIAAGAADAADRDAPEREMLPAPEQRERSAADLHPGWARALLPLDHLLGCGGDAGGAWLSDGGGVTPRWQRVGRQVAALFPLGHGLSQVGRTDPHLYLAQGLFTLLRNRRRLNWADPKLERLLKASLLHRGFWRNFLREWG